MTQQNTPRGIGTSIFFRLCWRAPLTTSSSRGLRRFSGIAISRCPARYCPVMDAGSASVLGGPSAITWPPCSPPRAEVHDVVGRAHRALVVFDDDHRIAEIAGRFSVWISFALSR